MKDINDIPLKDGSIIDIHQTVNGENLFVIFKLSPLDIRYACNWAEYEYNENELISPCPTTFETDFEIIGNIYE